SCTSHAPFQAMIFFFDCDATYFARYWSGRKITVSLSRLSTTCTAFAEVQQMSTSAFTSADVFTYATIGTPGNLSRKSRTSSPVIEEASEQPARTSGISTVLSGLRIFEVSAMKCTPACTMIGALVLVASIASCSESPTKSATQL